MKNLLFTHPSKKKKKKNLNKEIHVGLRSQAEWCFTCDVSVSLNDEFLVSNFARGPNGVAAFSPPPLRSWPTAVFVYNGTRPWCGGNQKLFCFFAETTHTATGIAFVTADSEAWVCCLTGQVGSHTVLRLVWRG